jgi:hypothetical protein
VVCEIAQYLQQIQAVQQRRNPKFVASFADSVFHHPHETFFDLTRFRRVTRYDGAGREQF